MWARLRCSRPRSVVMSGMMLASIRLQEPSDRQRKFTPVIRFGGQPFATGRGERINPRSPVVVARGHFGGEQAGRFEPVQGGVERSLADRERLAGDLVNPLLDAPAVIGPERARS